MYECMEKSWSCEAFLNRLLIQSYPFLFHFFFSRSCFAVTMLYTLNILCFLRFSVGIHVMVG